MKTGRVRVVLLALGFALIAIQFVPLVRDNPPVTGPIPNVPAPVAAALRRACYNCHSHETIWPGYSHVAPVSWLVARDVHEGRRHMNFSAWTAYTAEQRAKKRAGISSLVQDREMPPWFYLPLHREARLSAEDVTAIAAWADSGE
jgi:hypothetical protein